MESTIVWEGAEALREFLVPVDDLVAHSENPRRGDVMALVGSLRRFGQVRGIAVQHDGRSIVAGHHLVLAAREMGWTHIAALPNKFADEDEARAYLLADNQLNRLGGYDEAQQLSLMDDLATKGKLYDGTGITVDAHEDQRAAANAIPETEPPATWEGSYAEDAIAAAERAARLGSSRQMKEIVLMVSIEEHEAYGEHIRILRARYGTDNMTATALRAVREAALGEEANEEPATESLEAPAEKFDGEHLTEVVTGNFGEGLAAAWSCSCGAGEAVVHGEQAEENALAHRMGL